MARNTNTDIAVLEIAASLQKIIQDPTLKDSIAKAHAMSSDMQKKLDDANSTITKAAQISADQKKREDAITDINLLIAKQAALKTFNEASAKDLADQSTVLKQIAAQNAIDATNNAKENTRLQNVSAALDDRANKLKQSENDVAATKADLNKRISVINAQAI